ncbi:MAG: hypothetical protein JWQ38_3080 [Flavipsychrobacter sp.]|nr:hypothetical protein [Flavipsychrobacter sp.]
MNFKRKFILLISLVLITGFSIFSFPRYSGLVRLYDTIIFYPFQSLRSILLGFLPISIGDVLYVAGGIALLITIIRWLRYLFHFRTQKSQLASSVLNTVNAALFVYLLFVWGWGANYYKQPLGKEWGLYISSDGTKADKRKNDSIMLVSFDTFLVTRINAYAPHYHPSTFKDINERAITYYKTYTDSKVRMHGLGLKPTLFNYFLERTGVEGYYNPFTGEGQISTTLPAFIMPFVVCHEIAHQAGIAAEGDANLMAYALGSLVNDSTFNYSAYLSIWMYTNRRLYRRDSAMANAFEKQLNKLTTAQLDTLDQISKQYDNDVARYSSDIYDDYLKLQQQKEGLRSYGNVVSSAWQLELRRMNGQETTIDVP